MSEDQLRKKLNNYLNWFEQLDEQKKKLLCECMAIIEDLNDLGAETTFSTELSKFSQTNSHNEVVGKLTP